MKPCKHSKVVFTEIGVATVQWVIEDGAKDEGWADSPSPTGAVEVKCLECGREFAFGPKATLPGWVEKLREIVTK